MDLGYPTLPKILCAGEIHVFRRHKKTCDCGQQPSMEAKKEANLQQSNKELEENDERPN